MPLLGCATSVVIMIGLLGLIGWKVTVISSNFIALMLILNMAMNITLTILQLKEFPELMLTVFVASKNDPTNILHCTYNYMCIFIFGL